MRQHFSRTTPTARSSTAGSSYPLAASTSAHSTLIFSFHDHRATTSPCLRNAFPSRLALPTALPWPVLAGEPLASRCTARPPDQRPLIAVVVPARNEADCIGRAVRSLANQSCTSALHIFVVDDGSSDGTAEAARGALPEADARKLTIITGRPLPPGWTGKLWAVQQGIDAAMELRPQFLLLTDADVEHAPDNLATLISVAERQGYDLVSFMVKLHCQSFAEKLLIPAFVFFFFMLYPPLWIRSPRRRTAGAAGGCMLIRPKALELAGGIAAIRQRDHRRLRAGAGGEAKRRPRVAGRHSEHAQLTRV